MPKTQYTKDKTFRFTFRVNETLYNWVQRKADTLGVTPCDFVRSVIFNQMAAEDFFRATDKPVAEIARTSDANDQINQ